MTRRFGLILIMLAGIALLLAGGAMLWLSRADLAPLAARLASATLGRDISAGSLTLRPGFPLQLEIRDLKIANADWAISDGGSEPEMLRLASLSARIDTGALLGGVLRYERLEASGLRVTLERNPERTGNWEFPGLAGADGEVPDGGFALIPANRSQFPVLNDFILRDALIAWRTTGGSLLRIGLREASIRARDAIAPVLLEFDGSYNDTALRLQGRTASFAVLRDATRPFEAAFTVEGDNLRADFGGLIDRPLDFDAVQGRLSLEAGWLSALLRLFGDTGTRAAIPLSIQGGFGRSGDDWRLEDAFGQLGGQDFTGQLALTEQAAGQGDVIDAALKFPELQLDPLLAGLSDGSDKPLSLRLDTDPAGARVTARIETALLRYRSWRAAGFAAEARLAPGEADIGNIDFALGGGRLQGSVTARSRGEDGKSTHITARASLTKAEAAKLAALLGAEDDPVAGQVDARIFLEMTGATPAEAIKLSRGHLVAGLENGRIARALLEQASTDLRALFRSREGEAKLDCVLGIGTLQNGQVAVTPLRLHASNTLLTGGGIIDLLQQRLDLVLRSNPGASGFFALDIPLHFQGPFGNIKVRPTRAPATVPMLDAQVAIQALPHPLRQLALDNPCAS